MTRDDIKKKILQIFETEFEISDPGLDDNLTEEHDFDSIDALELLGEIESVSRTHRRKAIQKTAQKYADHLAENILQHPFQWYHFEPFLGKKIH